VNLSKEQKKEIVEEHIGLVKKVASKIFYRLPDCEIEFDDLVQTGIVGLLKALENYNEDKGKFSTYAYIRIRGEILDFLRQQYIMPKTEKDKITIECADKLGDELPISKNAIMLSLDKIISEDGEEFSFIDLFASKSKTPEEEYAQKELLEKISEAIDKYLDDNEKKIIQYLYFEEKDPKEISEIMNISLGRISQLKSRAVEKLKKILYDNIEG
jgi:RNA polymerase, sigma 28 subunit, SigD/FliA/WhiG